MKRIVTFNLKVKIKQIVFSPERLGLVDQLVVEVGDWPLVEVDTHGDDVEGRVLPPTVQGAVRRTATAARAAPASAVSVKNSIRSELGNYVYNIAILLDK